jgi:tetratricopeptide (TPR) repeat protein
MTIFSGDTQKHCVQLLMCCAVISLIISGVAGCRTQPNPTRDIAVDTIPDKESYLLSKLRTRYQDAETHGELGRYYLNQGMTDKAKYHLQTALGFDSALRPAQAAYIKLTIQLEGEMAGQRLCAEYQRPLVSSAPEMIKLAKALGDEGLDTLSLGCFQRILTSRPNSAEANRQLAYFYLTRKNVEKAKLHFSRSFELNPNQPDVAGELGRMGVTIETPSLPPVPAGDV